MLRISSLIGFLVLAIGVNGQMNGYTYYPEVKQLYKFYKTPQKWVDARETCRKEGSNLAMPKNAAEAAVLVNIFNGYPASSLPGVIQPNYLLLNFHSMFREGEYVSDKGVALQHFFHKWGFPPQPDNIGGERCGSLFRPGTLNDFSCDVPAVFICQKDKQETIPQNSLCMTKVLGYSVDHNLKKCYKLHLNPRAWPEARATCKAEGGNLAIINSKAEEDHLVKMFNVPEDKVTYVKHVEYALLGFHDLFQEGKFITVEGDDLQSIGYTNWYAGEPNGVNKENCGSMHFSGKLNDFPCDVPAVFFCEVARRDIIVGFP